LTNNSTFKGTEYPDEHVILGAHHDSRGSFLNPRAPGADDDGSGSSMLLQVARIIKANNLTFGRTFVISAFSGEGKLRGEPFFPVAVLSLVRFILGPWKEACFPQSGANKALILLVLCDYSIEQGLFGSAALAKKLKSQGTTITMMVQGVI
jgi:Zn-dependent M28 family amino/carboxypeptidase